MALAQNPSIAALSNLVLYYDAANVKSYPGAGTTINDIIGNNTSTLTNGAVWTGAYNGTFYLDGTDDFIQVNSSNALPSSNSARTINIVYIPLQINARRTCLFFYGNAANYQGWMISSTTSGKRTVVQTYNQEASASSSTDWTAGVANFITVVFDGTTVTYYLNGKTDGTATFATAVPNTTLSVNPRIGTFPPGWAGENPAQGQVAYVSVYNTALTAAQVQQNYNASRGRFVGSLPFAPTDISGLSLWFDADDPRTVFSNTSGTTRATTDATAIALWSDKSGNGRNAYQATGASQPLLKTGVLNNRNILRFDGSNDSLATAAAQVANSTDGSFTAFAVSQRTTTSGTLCVLNQDNSSATRCSQFVNFGGNGNVETIAFVAGSPKFSYTLSGTISASNYYILGSTGNTSTISAYSNGVIGSGAITGGNLAAPSQAVTLGSYGTAQQYLNGDIAELILYNSALSSTNRIKVEQYLQNKWGVNTPFVPTQISGIQLWLDSSDSGTLYQDSAGVTPAINDGDLIGLWKDKSGNARNVSQSTSANRPALKTSVQNSKNGIRFDGTNDFLSGSYGTTYANWTLFVVCKFSSASSYPMVYTDGNNELRLYGSTGYLEIISTNDPLVRDSVSCVGSTIIATPWNGATFALYKNGISLGTGVTQRALASTFYISSRSGSAYYLVGDVYEVISYNVALTTAQRQQVEAYLNQKWGVF